MRRYNASKALSYYTVRGRVRMVKVNRDNTAYELFLISAGLFRRRKI